MSEEVHPSDDKDIETVFNFPYLCDGAVVDFLSEHGRVFFIVRGLPGTGKSVLSTMLQDRYPTHEIYWADKMFLSPVRIERTPATVKKSHMLCHEKIEGFMKKNVPVIINRSTNVKVMEMSKYLQLAVKYGYTTLIADTSYKFSISPEELAATNTKRLSLDYMRQRCAQWQNVYPVYTGWFPSASDALFLFRRFSHIVNLLSESGWQPPRVLNSEGQPFCLGRRCWFGNAPTEKEYCDSKEVKDAYGTVHMLKIVGYAVTQGFALAVVILDEDQSRLIGHCGVDDDNESITGPFSELSISGWQRTSCEIKLEDIAEGDCEDDPFVTDNVENITDSDTVSFIILGSCSESFEAPLVASNKLPGLWKTLRERMLISEHGVACKERVTVDGAVAYRAQEDYLILDKGVELSGVFTGYYQPYNCKLEQCCSYFQRGMCRRGDSCLYKHEGPRSFRFEPVLL